MLEAAEKVINGIKAVRDLAKRIENLELQSKIADLISDTADLKLEMSELKTEIVRLRDENEQITRARDLRAKMVVKERLPYLSEPIDGYDDGPFCPVCLETKNILINLWESTTGWYCPHCQRTP